MEENKIDSVGAAELLGITPNNLRQLVFRKILVPVSKERRRSIFLMEDVERVKASRLPSVPSV